MVSPFAGRRWVELMTSTAQPKRGKSRMEAGPCFPTLDSLFQMVPLRHQLLSCHALSYGSHSQTRFPWEHVFVNWMNPEFTCVAWTWHCVIFIYISPWPSTPLPPLETHSHWVAWKTKQNPPFPWEAWILGSWSRGEDFCLSSSAVKMTFSFQPLFPDVTLWSVSNAR